jgi:hypothetical protein
MIMAGGSKSLEELIASTKKGILVTRTWYIRMVDPQSLLLTGLTRDGTFYIENGKIKHPVKNFRFNESPVTMLNNVEELGKPVVIGGDEVRLQMVIPPMKVRDFQLHVAVRRGVRGRRGQLRFLLHAPDVRVGRLGCGYPHAEQRAQLAGRVHDLAGGPGRARVALSDPKMLEAPFCYLAGTSWCSSRRPSARTSSATCAGGGFVFVDDCNHDIDGLFAKSFEAELAASSARRRCTRSRTTIRCIRASSSSTARRIRRWS